MSERILVAVAWPYANGSIHMGQVAGAYLPADIFARYHRMNGDEVLMVSGSDSHGTPVTLEAERRNVSPEDVFKEYHEQFLDNWDHLGISFDLFTSTHTDNHISVTQDIFSSLYKNGHISKGMMMQPFCESDNRFLADRYVQGSCPHCSFDTARGDQCDNCGRTLDPQDLMGMICLLCGNTPVIRETEHFFLNLSSFNDELLEWIGDKTYWRPNVRNFSIGYLESGLRDRAITMDIEWGVPVPLDGYESKRIYVWFEAVIGYLSASVEWAKSIGDESRWRDFWRGDSRSYYFMGKDNIPFHSIIWPAMLMGSGDLNLPYDVPANEYLNLEGRQFSTSRNWAVWLPEYLDKYDPDPLRYVLTVNMPETSDSDFSWREYVRANNEELVSTYGNLVHRVLTFTYKNFDARVPKPGNLDEISEGLISEARSRLEQVAESIALCRFREALNTVMGLAQECNRYLDKKEPWKTIKANRSEAATTLWVSMTVINGLKTMFYPFLPFSSEKLHLMLGFRGSPMDNGWNWDPEILMSGQKLGTPEPLFHKLDEDLVQHEAKKMDRS